LKTALFFGHVLAKPNNSTLGETMENIVKEVRLWMVVVLCIMAWGVLEIRSMRSDIKNLQSTTEAEQEVQRTRWCEEELEKNPNWRRPNWW